MNSRPVIDSDLFKAAMARLAGTVTIISTERDGDRRGITATAVCSLSANPPSLVACVNKDTGTCSMIGDTGRFAVNLLGDCHQDVAMTFAGATGLQGADRFDCDTGTWQASPNGLPWLTAAVVSFDCRVANHMDFGTHRMFVGEIVDASLSESSPLLFEQQKFKGLTDLPGAA